MNYSKETIWHFTCVICKGWWSVAASDEWKPNILKKLYCPHCGISQKTYDEDIGYTGIM